MTISNRKFVDRVGNVAWHLRRGRHKHIVRFTAKQYRDNPGEVARVLVRARNQLKVVVSGQRLTEAEVLKEFGR